MVEQKKIEPKPVPDFAPIRLGILGILFVLSLVLNTFLVFSVVDGSRIVREVEAKVGHRLSCDEAYNQREINNYFVPERRQRGKVIYAFDVLAPLWLLASIIVSIGLSIFWKTDRFYRWLPIIITDLILIYFVLAMPMIKTLGCALD